MSWFKNWFNTKYYHIIYKNRNDDEAKLFINNLIKKLNIKNGTKLIDIACGKGRHAKYFSKKGLVVTGIDLSENSINYANKIKSKNLEFKVHDMRNIYKKNYFDIATNLFTSIGYFNDPKDNEKTIHSIYESLKKEGLLIIDFLNSKKIIKELVPYHQKEINNINFLIRKKIENNKVIKDIEIVDKKKKMKFQEKVSLLVLNDFIKIIQKKNMKTLHLFGNYQLEEFNEEKSERLVMVFQKKNQ